MGVGSPILYLENRILKDIYSKKERHKRGNFFMSAEKIETSEAVYRDIYGKTKKKRRTKDQRRNAIRLLSQGSRREHRLCEAEVEELYAVKED